MSLAVLIFLAVLLIVDRQRPPGTGYLTATLAILGAFIGLRLAYDLRSPLLIYFPFVVFSAAFLYAPLIFLYSEKALFDRGKSTAFGILIAVPPALAMLMHSVFHLRFEEMRTVEGIVSQTGVVAPYSRVLIALALIYNLVFLLLTIRNLRSYSASYEEGFAGNDREQLKWLKLLTALNLFLLGSFLCVIAVISVFDLKTPQTPVEGIVALLMIYIILYYFVKKPAIFTLPAGTPVAAPGSRKALKYQKQNLSESERKAYLEKIEKHLAEEKPFLDDKVTLALLARELGIPPHHFSMVINIERNTNFYHFINAYRVDEAKALLHNPGMQDETVLDIGLMAGFQSKAGFNKVFKELTGMTPTAYRESRPKVP